MAKFKENWGNMSKAEQGASLVVLVGSIVVIVTAILQLTNIWEGAMALCQIFSGIVLVAQTILQWKQNRVVAVFTLCAALFVLGVATFILLVR